MEEELKVSKLLHIKLNNKVYDYVSATCSLAVLPVSVISLENN